MINQPLKPFVAKFRKITAFDVHFDSNWNLAWSHSNIIIPPNKEPNAVFVDNLIYNGYSKSRGGVHILFLSEKTGRRFSMFMSDFDEIIRANLMTDKIIKGKFCFTKKGTSQGVRYYFEP